MEVLSVQSELLADNFRPEDGVHLDVVMPALVRPGPRPLAEIRTSRPGDAAAHCSGSRTREIVLEG